MNCNKELKCSCFDIDLDEYHAPFCSAKCLIQWSKKHKDESVIDCAQNFDFNMTCKGKGGYYFPIGYNGHWITCENQFDVKNIKLKALIKELQRDRNMWENMAVEYSLKLLKLKKEKHSQPLKGEKND